MQVKMKPLEILRAQGKEMIEQRIKQPDGKWWIRRLWRACAVISIKNSNRIVFQAPNDGCTYYLWKDSLNVKSFKHSYHGRFSCSSSTCER